jgi:hypothetical protein
VPAGGSRSRWTTQAAAAHRRRRGDEAVAVGVLAGQREEELAAARAFASRSPRRSTEAAPVAGDHPAAHRRRGLDATAHRKRSSRAFDRLVEVVEGVLLVADHLDRLVALAGDQHGRPLVGQLDGQPDRVAAVDTTR